MMDKIVAYLSKTETFCHFAFLKDTIATANKIPFCLFGFWLRKRRNCGFTDDCFCKNFHAGFYSRVTEKTKAFLT